MRMKQNVVTKKWSISTIGHSNRTIEQFIELLQAHGIKEVVDIRTIPRSGYNPQFNKDRLPISLKKVGISYEHLEKLGGLRRTSKDSINLGWRNASFRGFADYMATPTFADGLKELMTIAKTKKTTIMCAEAVPWRCHRTLVGDALVKKKWEVEDILSVATARQHRMTPFLRVRAGKLVYPEIKS